MGKKWKKDRLYQEKVVKSLKGFQRKGYSRKPSSWWKKEKEVFEISMFRCLLSTIWEKLLDSYSTLYHLSKQTQVIHMAFRLWFVSMLCHAFLFVTMLEIKYKVFYTLSKSSTTELTSLLWHIYCFSYLFEIFFILHTSPSNTPFLFSCPHTSTNTTLLRILQSR